MKNLKYIITATAIGLLALILIVTKSISTPTKTTVNVFENPSTIIPEESTEEEVIEILGNPIVNNNGVLEFNSISPTRNHSVSFTDDKVLFFKEVIFKNKTVDDLVKQYGEPEYILYGELYTSSYYLLASPSIGIAYLGNPYSGDILEVWHFPKTDLETFLIEWASNYKTEKPKGPDQN